MLPEPENRLGNVEDGSEGGTDRGEKKGDVEALRDAEREPESPVESGAQSLSKGDVPKAHTQRFKILVVGKEDSFSERVMDYAVVLAARLGYDIISMNVDTVAGHSGTFLSPFKKHLREEFGIHAAKAAEPFREKASKKGIGFEHVVKYGDVSKAVTQLHHEHKHIEFVVTEPEPNLEGGDTEVAIPVFSMHSS